MPLHRITTTLARQGDASTTFMPEGDTTPYYPAVILSEEEWEEMGKPDRLTVTYETAE